MKTKTVPEQVRDAEQNYKYGNTQLSKYVSFSMSETIDTIDAYANSKHISGETDAMGREKPFFNIVTAATNIWYRATDLDRKDIRVLPSKMAQTATALLATVKLQDWMKKARFGGFLNQWGYTLAKYGSAVVKFVEQDGELKASVVPWNRFIADPVDFNAIAHIEKFYKTPEQLYAMATPGSPTYAGYDLEAVESLCNTLVTRKTRSGQNQDNLTNFIEIYEVHGNMDVRLLEDEPDLFETSDIEYAQQMHVISFQLSGKDYKDFTLFKGREKKDPYMITHLIEEDGRTLAMGAIEYLFNAQWMQNHTVKNMKDTLDLASKLIFQTADTTFVGKNVLTAIETGDIFITQPNMPLTRVANDNPSIAAMSEYRQMWDVLGQTITSTPDAMRGNTLPSGTPYALGALLQQQSASLFEIMTENKGLAVEDMMREYVLPFILRRELNNTDEIVATLDDAGIAEIDALYIPALAVKNHNQHVFDTTMQGDIPTPYDQNAMQDQARKQVSSMGNKRPFAPDELGKKTWKEAFKDFEWTVNVEVTNENQDKQATLTTLSTVFQSIASNPAVLQDPNARLIFGKILQETGVMSPMQLSAVQAPPPPMPQGQPVSPQGSPPVGVGGGINQ